MNKNRKWLLALSIAGLITANGIAMAAVDNGQENGTNEQQKPAFAQKGEMMKHAGMKENKADFQALLSLLQIDAKTLKTELEAGKTLVQIANEHGVSEQTLKDSLIAQMTKRIDEGVVAGKITADKAEQMKANLNERVGKMVNQKDLGDKKGMMRHQNAGHGIFNDAELLTLLKIDAETLKNELQAGKTLVAIANEHGVSEQTLKDSLIAQMTKRIDEGVAAGKITADKAEQMKANLNERVGEMVNQKDLGDKKGMMRHQNAGHGIFNDAELLTLLKIDAETLKNELQAGKTLVAIANEHGVSEQTLKDSLIAQMTKRLDEGVAASKISSDKAEQIKAGMDERVTNMINGKKPVHDGKGMMPHNTGTENQESGNQ